MEAITQAIDRMKKAEATSLAQVRFERKMSEMTNHMLDSFRYSMTPQFTVIDKGVMRKNLFTIPHEQLRVGRVGIDGRKGRMMIFDECGKPQAIIGNLAGAKENNMDACAPAPRKTVKERLSPVISALVDYAERTGRAEATVQFSNEAKYKAECRADQLEGQLDDAKYTLDRHMEREARLESDNKVMYAELRKRDEKVARAKAKAQKAKKATKKTTAKKSR